jgi:hypothetical protein
MTEFAVPCTEQQSGTEETRKDKNAKQQGNKEKRNQSIRTTICSSSGIPSMVPYSDSSASSHKEGTYKERRYEKEQKIKSK